MDDRLARALTNEEITQQIQQTSWYQEFRGKLWRIS